MSVDQGITFLSTTELTALMQRGELSPVELLDQVLERIDALDPRINAIVARLDATARAQAIDSEARFRRGEARPLEGIPVPIKDNVLVAGTVMTLGSRMAPEIEAPEDAALVARLRAAGAVFPAKTNLPEFGTIPSTESERFGACHNPWDLERTAGGSSGGAAAAVASGMVPVAHGNDGGGSLRIPAACCGLFSLKPTRGRIGRGPLDTDAFGLVMDGFLTRTVRDNARLLDAVVGSANGDPYWSPRPDPTFAEAVERDPGRLRVAFSTVAPVDWPLDPAVVTAVRDVAALCESLGHEVVEVAPQWDDASLVETFLTLWSTVIGMGVELLAMFGGDPERCEPHNRALHAMSRQKTAAEFAVAWASLQGWSRRVMSFFEDHDVLLTPTMCELPLRLGRVWEGMDTDPLTPLLNATALAGYTVLANITGQPAASLPLSEHGGLPVGVMAAGRLGEDALVLQLAAQLEAARPWGDRRPPLS